MGAPLDAAGELLWSRRVSGRQYLRARAIIDQAPPLLQDALLQRFARISGPVRSFYPKDGRVLDTWNDADRDLRHIGAELHDANVGTAFDDDAIEGMARRAARHCMTISLPAACAYAEAQHITLPSGPRVTKTGLRRRLVSSDWWRRRLRRLMTRTAEELFRRLGFVRKQTNPYVSDDALERVRQAGAKGRRWLSEMLAVCEDTGESIPLASIAEHSLTNPELRRGELMLRARGFQETAEQAGHRCIMATLTCPSAFHPWLRDSGEANPRYNGTTPRQAQRWLNTHWARARAAFKRRGLVVYGFRVAEPHHDATPHWHAILYAPRNQLWRVRVILRKVWLKDYRDEPGAVRHRVRFTTEHPSKGSGAAYIAKYIGKNIDGAGSIGSELSDESGRKVAADAERAVAWARLHGIRQFAQVGGPAVTCWRELRRVREPCDCPPLEALRLTTDDTGQEDGGPSWSAFITQLGGIAECLRASRALLDHAEPRCLDRAGRNVIRMTRWGELPGAIVIGLQLVWRDRIRRLPTRLHIWFLVFAPRGGALQILGPVAITVAGAPSYGAPRAWTNPHETSQAPP